MISAELLPAGLAGQWVALLPLGCPHIGTLLSRFGVGAEVEDPFTHTNLIEVIWYACMRELDPVPEQNAGSEVCRSNRRQSRSMSSSIVVHAGGGPDP